MRPRTYPAPENQDSPGADNSTFPWNHADDQTAGFGHIPERLR